MKLIFNIIAITGSAMYAGVMLAIGIILGGYWKTLSSSDFLISFSNSLKFIPKAISFVSLAALVGIIGSIFFAWENNDTRLLWLLAGLCMVVLLVFTMIWFGPTNAQFATKSLPIEQVPVKLNTWLMLHNIRIVLAALAAICGLLAINR